MAEPNMAVLFGFRHLTLERRQHLFTEVRQAADRYPYSLAPFGCVLAVEQVWCALTMIKRLEHLPFAPDEQRWWASRQEQLLDPTDPIYLQLVADQWGISQDPQYRRRLDDAVNNAWIAPSVRTQAQAIVKETYRQLSATTRVV